MPLTFKSGDAFFLRIGAGSLGGKARGLAFGGTFCNNSILSRRLRGSRRSAFRPRWSSVPDVFDRSMAENNLLDFAIHCNDDAEIQQRFLAAPLPTNCGQTCWHT